MTPRTPVRSSRSLFVALVATLLALSACSVETNVPVTARGAASESTSDSTSDEPTEPRASDSEDVDDSGDTGETSDDQPEGPSETADADEDSGSEEPGEGSSQIIDPLFELQGDLDLDTATVNSLIEFIQEETGRDFLRPPVIVAQSPEDFSAGLFEDIDEFAAEAEDSARFLQSLGLTDQGAAEIADEFLTLLDSPNLGVQGYYDPDTDELYVPNGTFEDGAFQGLLVHELTHALDGQHTDLTILEELSDAGDEDGNFDPLVAFQSVVEGRATSVENRWYAATGTPRADDPDPASMDTVPPALLFALSVPYAFGEIFIDANGGPANTWDLIGNPPLTTEEILVPDIGIGVEPVIDVPIPEADGPVLFDSTFGVVDVFTWLLGESLDPNPVLIFPTLEAIDGWAGGSTVTWGDEFESCTRIAIAGDSPTDLDEIEDAVGLWADAEPDRIVVRDGDLVVATACAPFIP